MGGEEEEKATVENRRRERAPAATEANGDPQSSARVTQRPDRVYSSSTPSCGQIRAPHDELVLVATGLTWLLRREARELPRDELLPPLVQSVAGLGSKPSLDVLCRAIQVRTILPEHCRRREKILACCERLEGYAREELALARLGRHNVYEL